MRKRVHMDISDWRAAAARGELWMYVDQHWDRAAPEGLTEPEWMQHFTARITAKTGVVPETGRRQKGSVKCP